MHDECTTQRCWSGSCQFAQLEITGGTGKTALVQGAFPDLVTVAGDGDTAVARRPATFIHTLAEHPNSTVEQLTQFADIGCSAPFGNLPDLERQGLATGTAGAGALAAGPTAGAWPM